MHRLPGDRRAGTRRVRTVVVAALLAVAALWGSAQGAGPTALACTDAAVRNAFSTGGSFVVSSQAGQSYCYVSVATPYTLAAGKTLTLDANGKTVVFPGPNTRPTARASRRSRGPWCSRASASRASRRAARRSAARRARTGRPAPPGERHLRQGAGAAGAAGNSGTAGGNGSPAATDRTRAAGR